MFTLEIIISAEQTNERTNNDDSINTISGCLLIIFLSFSHFRSSGEFHRLFESGAADGFFHIQIQMINVWMKVNPKITPIHTNKSSHSKRRWHEVIPMQTLENTVVYEQRQSVHWNSIESNQTNSRAMRAY